MEQHFSIENSLSETPAVLEWVLDGKVTQIQLREKLEACLRDFFLFQSNFLE